MHSHSQAGFPYPTTFTIIQRNKHNSSWSCIFSFFLLFEGSIFSTRGAASTLFSIRGGHFQQHTGDNTFKNSTKAAITGITMSATTASEDNGNVASSTPASKKVRCSNDSAMCGEAPVIEGQNSMSESALLSPAAANNANGTGKREDYLSWDDYFMAVAFLSAQRSKDPSTQVGACIVNKQKRIIGIGYNGFPKGCSDDVLPWARVPPANGGGELDTKYPYVTHAEVNAILNKCSADVAGATIYVALFPCKFSVVGCREK